MAKEKITLDKRELRKLFREVFYSAQKMSNYMYDDKKEKRTRIFVEDDALEYIMRIHTDWKFGKKPTCNQKYYNQIFKSEGKKNI
jgi:hypothetical protein